LAKDKRLTNILNKIYGEDTKAYYLYLSSCIFKNSEVTSSTKWHKDMPYWKGTSDKTSVWIPLNKVTKENGCLKYIPGSHNKNYSHQKNEERAGLYRKGFIDPNQIDKSEEILAEAGIGDATFHNCRIVHGSGKNTLAEERYALVFVYQPESDTSHHRDGPAELIPK
jgi:ectoine hydroxylase-related dioxygenase (phytanoyl-CoA dioxygenase family)